MAAPPEMKRTLASLMHHHDGCTVLRQDRNKIILRVPPGIVDQRELCAKLYLYPTLRCRFRAAGRRWGARAEFQRARRLAAMGAPVPVAIGVVEDRSGLGLPRRALFASEWATGSATLAAMIRPRDPQQALTPGRFDRLCFDVGRFIAALHAKGVVPRDMNPGNVLVRPREGASGEFDLLLVDYESIRFCRRVVHRRRIRPLIQVGECFLGVSAVGPRRLVRGYLSASEGLDGGALADEVDAGSHARREQLQRRVAEQFEQVGRARSQCHG